MEIKVRKLTDAESELFIGAGTGTGEVVQSFQNFSKDLYDTPFPVAYRPYIGSNGWGKLVSGTFSKID
jgi:hypothetical protein